MPQHKPQENELVISQAAHKRAIKSQEVRLRANEQELQEHKASNEKSVQQLHHLLDEVQHGAFKNGYKAQLETENTPTLNISFETTAGKALIKMEVFERYRCITFTIEGESIDYQARDASHTIKTLINSIVSELQGLTNPNGSIPSKIIPCDEDNFGNFHHFINTMITLNKKYSEANA